MKQHTAIVIGAGLAGLAAARSLRQAGVQVTVLEKNAYVGGRVRTDTVQGFKIDAGAQFLANFYTNTWKLIRQLGLQEMVVPIPSNVAIPRSGKLHRLSGLWALLSSNLISFNSKLTLAKLLPPLLLHWRELDVRAFHKAYQLDLSSTDEYVRRELSDELLEYLFQPALSGIFYWTPEHTSRVMLFLLAKSSFGMKLFTLRQGLGQLPEAMATGLTIQRNTEVTSVVPNLSGDYTIEACINGQQQPFITDGVVCTVPAVSVLALFPNLKAEQQAFFESIRYSASVVAAIGLNCRLLSDSYGLFCPGREIKYLGAATITSMKNSNQVPDGCDLILLFSSGLAGQQLLNEDDGVVQDKLWADLQQTGFIDNVRDKRCLYRLYRCYQALPEFDVGHFRRLKAFEDGKIESGNVVFAGDYLGGPFIEGAITSGLEAARRLLERLN